MYCGVLIKCDMYLHVAGFHLDLAQLWRCPVSWCTVWKGTPQDCMDHIRGAHDVPWEIKSASLEKYLPSWTVTRKVWSYSLAAQPSGISTDVLSTCPWCTTTESTSEVFRILLSGGTICHSYALCCRCQQSRRQSGWYRLTSPARVRCVRLGLQRSWIIS